ncbi:hypothetical protein OAG71_00720, partial [bacterium]|nr:hypothetical protein [bacterium]
SLQFFTTNRPIGTSSPEGLAQLPSGSTSTFRVPPASMVAFSVIRHAANDPSTLLEKEVSSIDKLFTGGDKLQTIANSLGIHHLPQNLLEDAMMDFSQLSARDFTALALTFEISHTHNTSDYETADSMLREFRDTIQTPPQIDAAELEVIDWLEKYHWNVLSGLKDFVDNALESKLDVYRTNAG